MATTWSKEELDFLTKNSDKAPSKVYKLYCGLFNKPGMMTRSYDSVQKKLKKLSFLSEEDDSRAPARKIAAPLESGTKSKRRKNYEEDIRAFIEALGDVTDKDFEKPLMTRGEGSSFCMLLSDTHFGKKTQYFDMETARERILSINESLASLMPEDCDEVVIILAGDMIEGEDIYQTQSHHIEDSAIEQCKNAVDAFWTLGQNIRNTFAVRVRYVTCPGNHGRVSKTAAEETNWDNMIYHMLGLIGQHQSDGGIVVDVNFKPFYTFPVKDKVGMIYHHGTKHTGTPAMQNKIGGWIYTKDFDFMCHGHWHHWEIGTHFGRPVIKNGSLPGEDDLSEQMGVWDPPRQAWFVVRNGQPIDLFGFFQWNNE